MRLSLSVVRTLVLVSTTVVLYWVVLLTLTPKFSICFTSFGKSFFSSLVWSTSKSLWAASWPLLVLTIESSAPNVFILELSRLLSACKRWLLFQSSVIAPSTTSSPISLCTTGLLSTFRSIFMVWGSLSLWPDVSWKNRHDASNSSRCNGFHFGTNGQKCHQGQKCCCKKREFESCLIIHGLKCYVFPLLSELLQGKCAGAWIKSKADVSHVI